MPAAAKLLPFSSISLTFFKAVPLSPAKVTLSFVAESYLTAELSRVFIVPCKSNNCPSVAARDLSVVVPFQDVFVSPVTLPSVMTVVPAWMVPVVMVLPLMFVEVVPGSAGFPSLIVNPSVVTSTTVSVVRPSEAVIWISPSFIESVASRFSHPSRPSWREASPPVEDEVISISPLSIDIDAESIEPLIPVGIIPSTGSITNSPVTAFEVILKPPLLIERVVSLPLTSPRSGKDIVPST